MNVLLADNSNESACGCSSLLREMDPGVSIHRAKSLSEAVTGIDAHPHVDLILWHACEQTDDKFRLVRAMADRAMGVPVVIVATHSTVARVAMAIQAGANGYIPLPMRRRLIIEILRLILSGGTYFPASMLTGKLRAGLDQEPGRHMQSATAAHRDLTPRQRDVLELLVDGRTNREIADSLGIAEATAKQHVSALLRAMKVRSRDEAIQLSRPGIVMVD